MINRKLLDQIIEKQQDLIRDFQHCLNHSQDKEWQDFFGAMAREQAELAHRCLEKTKRHRNK
jgi:hypothetical protein